MSVCFKKTKSNGWAVCGPVAEVTVGSVEVTTKSGKTRTVEVETVGKPFDVSWADEEVCYGYLAAKKSKKPAPAEKLAPVAAPVEKAPVEKAPVADETVDAKTVAKSFLKKAVKCALEAGLTVDAVVDAVRLELCAADYAEVAPDAVAEDNCPF